LILHKSNVIIRQITEIFVFRDVMPDQAVGVLVRSSFPGRIRMSKINGAWLSPDREHGSGSCPLRGCFTKVDGFPWTGTGKSILERSGTPTGSRSEAEPPRRGPTKNPSEKRSFNL